LISVFKTIDAAEPSQNGEFVITIPSGYTSSQPLTINYTVSGTAVAGTDYQALSGSVTIPAGANVISVPVTVIDNLLVDGTRNVQLTVVDGSDGIATYTPAANNTASVDIADNDVAPGNSFEAWKLATVPAANTNGYIHQGEIITYTIYVRNTGSTAITSLTVNDPIPVNTDYVSGGTFSGTSVSFAIADLQPGAVTEVSFQVRTFNTLTGVTEITNTASVTDGFTTLLTYSCDPRDFSCNKGNQTIVPVDNLPGDLSITKTTVYAGTYLVGQTVTYNIVVTNNGPGYFLNVLAIDSIPAGLDMPSSYTSDKGTIEIDPDTRKVICKVPQLLQGESVTITVTANILAQGEIVNTAYVSASQAEANLTNNETSCKIKVTNGDIFFVNAFRPGSSVNGKFTIVGLSSYPGSRLRVYNRWGSLVYQSNNYQNNWTGENLPIGAYVYVVDVKKDTGTVTYTGSILLIK
jgi:uncharacterized repeat protein (TIGR01451 family)